MNRVHVSTKKFIIALVAIFFAHGSYSQSQSLRFLNAPALIRLQPQADSIAAYHKAILLQTDHYTRNLSFICKQEWLFEKTTRVPLRIRVGTLDQCNFLEGKKY